MTGKRDILSFFFFFHIKGACADECCSTEADSPGSVSPQHQLRWNI